MSWRVLSARVDPKSGKLTMKLAFRSITGRCGSAMSRFNKMVNVQSTWQLAARGLARAKQNTGEAAVARNYEFQVPFQRPWPATGAKFHNARTSIDQASLAPHLTNDKPSIPTSPPIPNRFVLGSVHVPYSSNSRHQADAATHNSQCLLEGPSTFSANSRPTPALQGFGRTPRRVD